MLRQYAKNGGEKFVKNDNENRGTFDNFFVDKFSCR